MLRLSRKMVYAVEAVADIAYNARLTPVQSRDITKRQGIPQRYLEQVMQKLVRAGILKGVRGPRGGYRLARERRRISVGDIVRVVAELENADDLPLAPGSQLSADVVRPIWTTLEDEMLERLDQVSMEDLCQDARAKAIPSAADATTDFTI